MPKEDQAQADLDQHVPGDPAVAADSSHDPDEGATKLDAYNAQLADLMNAAPGLETPAEPPPEEAAEEPPAEEEAAADDAEAPPEAEPAEEAKGDGEEDEPDDDEPKPSTTIKTTRFRIPVSDEVAVEALGLKKRHPDWSLTKCEEKAKAILGKPTEADGEAAPDTGQPAETVESCRAKLKELREAKAQAIEDVDFAEVAKFDLEIEGLRDRIEDLRVEEARAEQSEREAFIADVDRSKNLAVEVYPATADADSALVAKMVEIDKTLQELDDPLFFSPNKPFKLAQMAAAELGIAPNTQRGKAAKSPQNGAPKAPPASRPTTHPASGNARTSTPTANSRFSAELAKAAAGGLHDYEAIVAGLTNG